MASGIASIGARRWSIGTSAGGSPIGAGGGGAGGGAGAVSDLIPSAIAPSITLSTPVPTANAGDRLTSRSDWNNSGGNITGTAAGPISKLTQPSIEKNKNSILPQISPEIRDTFE